MLTLIQIIQKWKAIIWVNVDIQERSVACFEDISSTDTFDDAKNFDNRWIYETEGLIDLTMY